MTRRTAPATKPVRCAIYTRKSTDEGLDNGFSSLDAQREAAEAFIQSQKHEGWIQLPDRYDDGGFSGGSMDRPALKRLLTDVEAGHVDAVVVYKVDRLSRSLLDFARIMEVLDGHGAAFVSITQQFATNTSIGRLTLNMLLSFAQFERELIAERTRDKMSAARKKGKWVGGIPMLGYDIDPQGGRLVVNECEAEAVRAIFQAYLDHGSLLATVRELDRRGIRTKRWTTRQGSERGGKPWDKVRLRYLLKSPIYVGKVAHRGLLYPGEHEAIVSEEVWERVQERFRRNDKAGGGVVRNKHDALLAGLLWCVSCGARMTPTYTQRGDRRYRYYLCRHAQALGRDSCPTKILPAAEIERFVVERLRALGSDAKFRTEVLAKVCAEWRARAAALADDRRQLERDLARWTAEPQCIVKAGGANGGLRVTGQLAALQNRLAAAEQRLAEIRDEAAALSAEQMKGSEVVPALEALAARWETLPPQERFRIAHLLIERVAYDGERETVAITFWSTGIRELARESQAWT